MDVRASRKRKHPRQGCAEEVNKAKTRKDHGNWNKDRQGSMVCSKDTGVGRAWGQAKKARLKGVAFLLSAVETH